MQFSSNVQENEVFCSSRKKKTLSESTLGEIFLSEIKWKWYTEENKKYFQACTWLLLSFFSFNDLII